MSDANIVHHIGGQPGPGSSDRCQPVWDPATGISNRRVALANAQDVDAAVAAARGAFPAWADTPPLRRARLMNGFLLCREEWRQEPAVSAAMEVIAEVWDSP